MSPRPVSLLVWRDAKSDPPKGQTRGVFVEFENGKVWTAFANTLPCEGSPWDGYDDVRRWAEIPVLSDLTDYGLDTILLVAEGCFDRRGVGPEATGRRMIRDARAALGGEKEEA